MSWQAFGFACSYNQGRVEHCSKQGGDMGWMTGSVAILAGVLGLVTGAPAENRGLSPIVQQSQVKTDRTIGVCSLVQNPMREKAFNGIGPIGAAQFYFESIEHRQISITGVVTVLQNPEHGTLEPNSDAPDGYLYLPEVAYFGPDRATFLVEVDGRKIKVEYFFKVLQGVADDYTEEQYKNLCPKGNFWKISSTLNSNGTRINRGQATITS